MKKISEFFTVCKDCAAPDRHPGCHDTCEHYRKEREKYEDAKKQEEREKKQRTYVSMVELTADQSKVCISLMTL